jgi:hypothetical protein
VDGLKRQLYFLQQQMTLDVRDMTPERKELGHSSITNQIKKIRFLKNTNLDLLFRDQSFEFHKP